jgi:hypothetical protein
MLDGYIKQNQLVPVTIPRVIQHVVPVHQQIQYQQHYEQVEVVEDERSSASMTCSIAPVPAIQVPSGNQSMSGQSTAAHSTSGRSNSGRSSKRGTRNGN